MRPLGIFLVALCIALTAQAATVVSFVSADRDDALTLRNPHATAVTVVLRAIGSPRAPMQLTLAAGEARTIAAALVALSFEQDGILAIESSDTLAGIASLPMAFPTSPVRVNVSTASPILVAGAGTIRVSVYDSASSQTPLNARTYTGDTERLLRLPLSSLLPFGSPLSLAEIAVEPVSGTAVAAVHAVGRRRAVRAGQSIASPLLTIDGAVACEFATGVRARVAPVAGQTYAWTLRNASAASLSGSQVDLALGTAGYAHVSVVATSPQGSARSDAVVRIEARPTVSSLTVPSAVQGQQVTISGETNGESVTLSGTDISSTTVQVNGGAFSYSYTAPTTGEKSVRAVAQNACGNGERTVSYAVGASCNTPSATITAPSTASAHTVITATMPAGASSYSWTVTGGKILAGQDTRSIDILTVDGQLRINGTASNGGGCESSDSVSVTVTKINEFSAASTTVGLGGSTTLTVDIENATSYSITSSLGNSINNRTGNTNGRFSVQYFRDVARGQDQVTLTVHGPSGPMSWILLIN